MCFQPHGAKMFETVSRVYAARLSGWLYGPGKRHRTGNPKRPLPAKHVPVQVVSEQDALVTRGLSSGPRSAGGLQARELRDRCAGLFRTRLGDRPARIGDSPVLGCAGGDYPPRAIPRSGAFRAMDATSFRAESPS